VDVTAVYRLGHALGAFRNDDGTNPGLFQRHGFWLVALNVGLYVPLLGSYSLSDPWETHYGEVAREMLARDDWISTWWAQDGWFWSKPVLDFWSQALSFSLLGVKYMPGEMLRAAERGLFPQPEWAARMPVFSSRWPGCTPRTAPWPVSTGAARVSSRPRTDDDAVLVPHRAPDHDGHAVRAPLAATMALALLGFVTDPNKRSRCTR